MIMSLRVFRVKTLMGRDIIKTSLEIFNTRDKVLE
jgi:hypothetical protein